MKSYMGLIGYYPFFFLLLYIYVVFNLAKTRFVHIKAIQYMNENFGKILKLISKYYNK